MQATRTKRNGALSHTIEHATVRWKHTKCIQHVLACSRHDWDQMVGADSSLLRWAVVPLNGAIVAIAPARCDVVPNNHVRRTQVVRKVPASSQPRHR
jgi:hypothetical protein